MVQGQEIFKKMLKLQDRGFSQCFEGEKVTRFALVLAISKKAFSKTAVLDSKSDVFEKPHVFAVNRVASLTKLVVCCLL